MSREKLLLLFIIIFLVLAACLDVIATMITLVVIDAHELVCMDKRSLIGGLVHVVLTLGFLVASGFAAWKISPFSSQS